MLSACKRCEFPSDLHLFDLDITSVFSHQVHVSQPVLFRANLRGAAAMRWSQSCRQASAKHASSSSGFGSSGCMCTCAGVCRRGSGTRSVQSSCRRFSFAVVGEYIGTRCTLESQQAAYHGNSIEQSAWSKRIRHGYTAAHVLPPCSPIHPQRLFV
jgi:hypothetical protein